MKKLFIFMFLIFVLPMVFAINVDVKKISSDEVLIYGINKPATFNLEITNLGGEDNLKFYNLLGFSMFPVGTVHFNAGETQNVELGVSPIGVLDSRGVYSFEYYIRGQDESEVQKKLTLKIIDLKDAFEIGANEINPESNTIQLYIKNKVNFNFDSVDVKFSSAFFKDENSFSILPYEEKTTLIELNKEDFKKLSAGFYTLDALVNFEGKETNVEGTISFTEKKIVTTTKKDYGLIISTKIIEKSNEGNAVTASSVIVDKNIISRLFTSFSPEPDIVERDGLKINYVWNSNIKPGESLRVVVKTNWIFPFLLVFFVVTIVVLTKTYSNRNLVARKSVSFVNAKGGEFALKIKLFIQAKTYIENVNVIDRLPPLTKLYEKFAGEIPKHVNEKARKIEWIFEKLEPGEIRVISYILYSKIGVLGRFALPSAAVIYEKDGKIKETSSNRAFFVAEQRTKDLEDY